MFIEKCIIIIGLYVCLHVFPAYFLRCGVHVLLTIASEPLMMLAHTRHFGWLLNPNNAKLFLSNFSFLFYFKIKLFSDLILK